MLVYFQTYILSINGSATFSSGSICYVHYSQATIDSQSEAIDESLVGLQAAFLTLTGMEVS